MAGTPKLRFGLFGTGHWAGQVHAAALTAFTSRFVRAVDKVLPATPRPAPSRR